MIKSCTIGGQQSEYRYILLRRWDNDLPTMLFIMLNPSTADHEVDDPTIRKCIGYAERLGYGEIKVVNLFAFRATKPSELKRFGYPVGPMNDQAIELECLRTDTIVCAWGANARGLARTTEVLRMLKATGRDLYAVKLLSDGTPAHPLMQRYVTAIIPYRPEVA